MRRLTQTSALEKDIPTNDSINARTAGADIPITTPTTAISYSLRFVFFNNAAAIRYPGTTTDMNIGIDCIRNCKIVVIGMLYR
jgi:hypothetical protein